MNSTSLQNGSNKQAISSPVQKSKLARWSSCCEIWIQTHSGLIAALVLVVGFLVRIYAAHGTFLNPDEALHFSIANTTSLRAAYEGSLHLSHPPLLILVLYFWRIFGIFDFVLRLPSVIAGTIFCWSAFKWLTNLFGQAAGWIGFIFLAFLPSTIALSAEVRQYALLLVFATAAVYLLERALVDNSAKLLALSFFCLYLAMLSHYSAFLFAGAIGIYALLRMVTQRFPARIVITWLAGQLFGLGIAIFLYVTHLSRLEELQGANASEWIPSAYLPNSYFHPGHGGRLWWALARTGGVFQYMFEQLGVGDLAYLLFILGIVLLLRRKTISGKFAVDSRLLGILLLLPFVLTSAIALTGRYPYGGTRHSAFLVIFAIAGVSVLIAKITDQRITPGLGIALLVVVICNAFASHHQPYISRADQSSAKMQGAIIFIRQQVSPTGTIFVDNQTGILLRRYLCQGNPVPPDRSVQNFRSFQCGGYRIIATAGDIFAFTAGSFLKRWNEMVSKYHLRSGQTVWIMQAGWNADLTQELANFPEFRDLKTQSFGKNISIFKLAAGQRVPIIGPISQ